MGFRQSGMYGPAVRRLVTGSLSAVCLSSRSLLQTMLSDPCIAVMIVKTMGVVRRRARALATAEKSTCQLQFPTSIQMGRLSPTHVAEQHERVFNGPRRLSEAVCQFWDLDDHVWHGVPAVRLEHSPVINDCF